MIYEKVVLELYKDVGSPTAKQIGKLIAKPFILVNYIASKEMVLATKDAFIFICNKLDKKNKNNLPYIESSNTRDTRAIYEVLENLRWGYDGDSVQIELFYELLLKLITNPTKEEEGLVHARILDNLYPYSLDMLYLIDKLEIILNSSTECYLKYENQEIKPECVDIKSVSDYQGLDILGELEDNLHVKRESEILSNNADITDKNKYIRNLVENNLISNYQLKSENEDIKRLIFLINNKRLVSNASYIILYKYKYFVTDTGKDLLQYYSDDVVTKIESLT